VLGFEMLLESLDASAYRRDIEINPRDDAPIVRNRWPDVFARAKRDKSAEQARGDERGE